MTALLHMPLRKEQLWGSALNQAALRRARQWGWDGSTRQRLDWQLVCRYVPLHSHHDQLITHSVWLAVAGMRDSLRCLPVYIMDLCYYHLRMRVLHASEVTTIDSPHVKDVII